MREGSPLCRGALSPRGVPRYRRRVGSAGGRGRGGGAAGRAMGSAAGGALREAGGRRGPQLVRGGAGCGKEPRWQPPGAAEPQRRH